MNSRTPGAIVRDFIFVAFLVFISIILVFSISIIILLLAENAQTSPQPTEEASISSPAQPLVPTISTAESILMEKVQQLGRNFQVNKQSDDRGSDGLGISSIYTYTAPDGREIHHISMRFNSGGCSISITKGSQNDPSSITTIRVSLRFNDYKLIKPQLAVTRGEVDEAIEVFEIALAAPGSFGISKIPELTHFTVE